ncbi:MAG: hypothetical protein AB1700_20050 [Bacillota bacterium]
MNSDLAVFSAVSRHYGPTQVQAGQFFVSYNSVLTLAYEGFSRTLLDVKRHVESAMHGVLRPENPGSKWPKTTLGCLVKNKTPRSSQIKTLRAICCDFTGQLRSLSDDDRRVPIGELKVVVFGCRTLEKRLFSLGIRLDAAVAGDDGPPQEHVDAVQRVMAQFAPAEHQRYYPKLKPDGRILKTYYRQPHTEATLIADVSLSGKARDLVCAFCREVDVQMPGPYAWFDESSWHLTVRALVPR